jgi:hypothetical protein
LTEFSLQIAKLLTFPVWLNSVRTEFVHPEVNHSQPKIFVLVPNDRFWWRTLCFCDFWSGRNPTKNRSPTIAHKSLKGDFLLLLIAGWAASGRFFTSIDAF